MSDKQGRPGRKEPRGRGRKPAAAPPDPAEREALARMAKSRDSRAATRARVVMALLDGEAPAHVAQRIGVAFATIRAAWQRFDAGGAPALATRRRPKPPPPLPPAPRFRAPVQEALLSRSQNVVGSRGRIPAVRLAVATWLRDAAALGVLPPGARLPVRRWFQKFFHTTCGVIQSAFAMLARDGWTRTVRHHDCFLANPLPFAGRYLMLLGSPLSRPRVPEGLDAALERAAREQERRCPGIRWDVRDALAANDPEYPGLLAAIAEQRWAGVFVRAGVVMLGDKKGRGHYSFLDRVPISGFLHPDCKLGSHARSLTKKTWSQDSGRVLAALLRAARAAGRHRALVLAVMARRDDDLAAKEAEAREIAAAQGMTIPDNCWVPCPPGPGPGQIEPITALALRVAEVEGCDAILAMQDNYVEPLDRVLCAYMGAAAAAKRYFLAAWGSRPITQKAQLPFEWHGQDLSATLESFVAWCDAIHAGVKSPPPPQVVEF